jgi:hypothetical protein
MDPPAEQIGRLSPKLDCFQRMRNAAQVQILMDHLDPDTATRQQPHHAAGEQRWTHQEEAVPQIAQALQRPAHLCLLK